VATVPRLSVVLPVFNCESTVERAIRSVLDGVFKELELIVVDDGSTDRGLEVISAIDDPRLRVLKRPRRGVASATNEAVSVARAPVIGRIDADDMCRPEKFELQMRTLVEENCDIVSCGVRIADGDGAATSGLRRYERWLNSLRTSEEILAARFIESPIPNPTAIAWRDVYELGFRDGPWPEDYDFWLRAFEQGFRAVKRPEILYDWMDHGTRLTRTSPRYSRDAFERRRRMALLDGPLRDRPTVDIWGAGRTGRAWFRWALAERLSVRRIVDVSPRLIGRKRDGVPIVAPESLPLADGTLMLGAVGADGARVLIRNHLQSLGYRDGVDLIFVA